MDDRNLDTAIDDVARQMTAGEPDAGFRARVVARIESGVGSPESRVGRWRWAVAALGAAAMIVAAVVVFRTQAPVDRGAGPRVLTTPPAGSSTAQARSAGPEGPALQPRAVPQRRGASVRREDAPNAASEIDALAPPPLAPFPLDVTSIAVGALPPADSIQLDKLEPITPIAVAPLGEGDRP